MVVTPCVFSFQTLMPAEAQGVLSSLLAIVSRLSHLLPRASHVLEHLPKFLHTPNITALLDLLTARQVCVTGPQGSLRTGWASGPAACTSFASSGSALDQDVGQEASEGLWRQQHDTKQGRQL